MRRGPWRYWRWVWAMRGCPHPPHRLAWASGGEYHTYGYRHRCRDCGKALKEQPR